MVKRGCRHRQVIPTYRVAKRTVGLTVVRRLRATPWSLSPVRGAGVTSSCDRDLQDLENGSPVCHDGGALNWGYAMNKVIANDIAADTEAASAAYVPSLQLTEGQSPPIAANGGLSYMSFDQDGDAGTAAAMEAALIQIAEGKGQAVIDMLDNAPPGPIETRWGVGFRDYAECVEYIRANNIEAPEGGLALPLPYTINEQPSYSIVSSNALWQDPSRESEAKALRKDERDNTRRRLFFPHVMRDARRIAEYYPGDRKSVV